MLHITERNQDATLYVGGLDDQCTEAILWELFTQAGPVVNVHMPKDRITGNHQGYGFVEFASEEDADYAIKIMNMIKLYGKPLRANKASAHQKNQDIGANIFIGNLDPDVDEKLLYDTFSSFGTILQTPKIMRDYSSNNSRGYAFINYASFEASDAVIESMNGQYFSNRPVTVSYAFKKDSKGERHGTMVERLLAQKNKMMQGDKPSTNVAEVQPIQPKTTFQPPPSLVSITPGPVVGVVPSPGIPIMTPITPIVPMAALNPLASINPILAPPPPPTEFLPPPPPIADYVPPPPSEDFLIPPPPPPPPPPPSPPPENE